MIASKGARTHAKVRSGCGLGMPEAGDPAGTMSAAYYIVECGEIQGERPFNKPIRRDFSSGQVEVFVLETRSVAFAHS
jgi:hypothetical protein